MEDNGQLIMVYYKWNLSETIVRDCSNSKLKLERLSYQMNQVSQIRQQKSFNIYNFIGVTPPKFNNLI